MSTDDTNKATIPARYPNTPTSDNNILKPVYTDRSQIIWDGNDATIEGTLHEVGRFYKRRGLFQTFLKHHAVPLSNGKLAVDSANTVYYTTGKIVDSHDFDDPCPPTTERFHKTNVARSASSKPLAPELTAVPAAFSNNIIIAEHTVEAEDSRLLRLAHARRARSHKGGRRDTREEGSRRPPCHVQPATMRAMLHSSMA